MQDLGMVAATLPRPPPPRLDTACALFLDVDGTLLEFASHPDLVALPQGALATIGRLSDRLRGAVALVSGRPLGELDTLFAPLQLPAAGLHGQQVRGAEAPAAAVDGDALATLRREAALLAERHPGIVVEDKGANLALHWRMSPEGEAPLRELAAEHLARLPGYRLQPGDHVVELVPADIDKGRAVDTLMGHAPFAGRVPVFVGDDLTDEYGFAAVHAAGGWSVLVGNREPSCARYALPDTAAVHQWLRDSATSTREGA